MTYPPKPSDDDPRYDEKMAELSAANPMPTHGWSLTPCCRRDPWDCECPAVCEDCGQAYTGLGLCGDCHGGK